MLFVQMFLSHLIQGRKNSTKISDPILFRYILIGSNTSYCDVQDKAVGWSNSFPECVSK